MLIMTKLFPKTGMTKLWRDIESERSNFYWDDVKPIFAMRLEGKGHVDVVLDVKNLDTGHNKFLEKLNEVASIRKSRTIPIISPIMFPTEEGVHYTLERYFAQIQVAPEYYLEVYNKLLNTKFNNDTYADWISYSLGKEDILLSVFSADRESTVDFLRNHIGDIRGVNSIDVHRAIKFMPLLSSEEYQKLRMPFLYSNPPGVKGSLSNPQLYDDYLGQSSPMICLVRLFTKRKQSKLWDEIKGNITKFETKDIKPLYATSMEGRAYITVVFEIANFEVLKNFLIENIHTLKNVRETRTIPLIEPRYFLLPEGHPTNLERYLLYLKTDSKKMGDIRQNIENLQLPENVLLTYSSLSLGHFDIFLSILSDSRETIEKFAEDSISQIDGLMYYDISYQEEVFPLASKEARKAHQMKFLAERDKARMGQ